MTTDQLEQAEVGIRANLADAKGAFEVGLRKIADYQATAVAERGRIGAIVGEVGRIALIDEEATLTLVETFDPLLRVNALAEVGKATRSIEPIKGARTVLEGLVSGGEVTRLQISRKFLAIGHAAVNIDNEFAADSIRQAPQAIKRARGLIKMSTELSGDYDEYWELLALRRSLLSEANSILAENSSGVPGLEMELMSAAEPVDLSVVASAIERFPSNWRQKAEQRGKLIRKYLHHNGGYRRLAEEIPTLCVAELEKALSHDPTSAFSGGHKLMVIAACLLEHTRFDSENYKPLLAIISASASLDLLPRV